VTETEKAAREAADELFLVLTDKACELQNQAKEADDQDEPLRAELRRTMEQLADLERELRARDQLRLFLPVLKPPKRMRGPM
jgi:peptidoglycan hydrolase CwlO-like protein